MITPSGARGTFQYDAEGRLEAQADALDHRITLVWNAAGERIARQGPDGGLTSYTYNAHHQVTEVMRPSGMLTTLVYERQNLVARVNPLGQRTTYAYNAAGQRVATENALGPADDVDGGRDEPDHGGGESAGGAADDQLRLKRPGGGASGRLGRGGQTQYDGAGRVEAEVDPLGHRTTYGYDCAGQPDGDGQSAWRTGHAGVRRGRPSHRPDRSFGQPHELWLRSGGPAGDGDQSLGQRVDDRVTMRTTGPSHRLIRWGTGARPCTIRPVAA